MMFATRLKMSPFSAGLLASSIAFSGLLASESAARAEAKIPRPAPAFHVPTLSGTGYDLAQYKGKVVVLAFILTYCSHCQATTGVLTKLQNELGPKGFQVVATAVEDGAQGHILEFQNKFRPNFPVGYTNRPDVEAFLQHDAKTSMMMPQLVFIDQKGVIQRQMSGNDEALEKDPEANLRKIVTDMLAGKAGKKTSAVKPDSKTARKSISANSATSTKFVA